MNLKTILCMLLQSVCNAVTAVEDAVPPGTPGADKKTAVQPGIAAALDDLVNRGAQFVRTEAEAVANEAVDSIVGLAHKLGAFTHHTPEAPKDAVGNP